MTLCRRSPATQAAWTAPTAAACGPEVHDWYLGATAAWSWRSSLVWGWGERAGVDRSRGTRILGGLTLAGFALLLAYALVWSPADREMQDSVRLIYAHVPSAILAYTGCGITTLASAMWLRRRSEGWWVLAGAAAEVATVFTALALVTGSIWGRPTWGSYWQWDPRITSTTLLLIMLIGVQALRRIDNESGDAASRGMRGAIVGLLLFPNVVIIHFSVDWWRSLHQTATITRLDPPSKARCCSR